MRLDRFLSNYAHTGRRQALQQLASRRVRVNGSVITDGCHPVDAFSHIELDGLALQCRAAHYLMLHKPPGYASATRDAQHPTVLDLIDTETKEDLHIAGRLDFNTSGLMLLTNDGLWSRQITEPGVQKSKVYYVETEQAIHPDAIAVFAEGLYFRYENLTTRPAQLQILAPNQARLTLQEGRYHQVKRMFGHFNNKVTRLHRESMGEIVLDPALAAGHYRALTAEEIASVWRQTIPAPKSLKKP